jgi:5-methyltetrahydropteroyltriglutamate--homocysteine methyltransferase
VEYAPQTLEVKGKLNRSHPIFVDHFKFVQANTRVTPKLTIPSPSNMHFRGGRAAIDKTAYPDMAEFYADLARVYAEEVRDLAAAGCRYLQIDETNIPGHLSDPTLRAAAQKEGEDPDALVTRYAKLINDCVRDVPDDMTVCVHMCRGNHAGGWFAEGGYDPVAVSFREIDVDGFFLEYDTPRAGSFAPLAHLGRGKIAVLGLITTKSPVLENKDDLKRRIDEAATFAPLEHLAISPQCGFASTIEGNPLSEDDQRRKLELVVSVARDVWG